MQPAEFNLQTPTSQPPSNLPPTGDAHVIRNAGGRASDDALRSLTISQRLLGTTEIHVIHHTDCGMLTFTNEQVLLCVDAPLSDARNEDWAAVVWNWV